MPYAVKKYFRILESHTVAVYSFTGSLEFDLFSSDSVLSVVLDEKASSPAKIKKRKFVFTANELDTNRLFDEKPLEVYKDQVITIESG